MTIMKEKQILCIDFDGTIVERAYPEIGELKPYAKEAINMLSKDYHIIIWTCRTSQKLYEDFPCTIYDAAKFLRVNEIHFDTINHNIYTLPFQPYPKVYADVYIDDRNLGGIPPWPDIYNILTGKEFFPYWYLK